MVKRKHASKIRLNSEHVKKLISFIEKILQLSQTERAIYFKSIKSAEIDLVTEIILNFIECNVKHDNSSLQILKRVKNYMYMLASKKTSIALKKKILQSLKGLNILNIVLPLVLNALT